MASDNKIQRIISAVKIGTVYDAKAHGLTENEFERITKILGRTANITELSIFSVMWSEHCSYKNSILEIKKLPRSGDRLLAEAGSENAGLVDIGDNLAVAFKIESHNHPSAVEPFQGAATGVGGILRDIFTMGARPLAILDSIRFGSLTDSRNRFLFDGVVKGIGHYGNCFGVPTVAGEVNFDDSYAGNPLVNAMAVGIVEHDKIATAEAKGIGNPVFYVGSRTGRDGIHGATFASEELSGEDDSKRPSVQVGDPFAEKLLLEATLELAGSEALVSIQDMGAAGLTCCSCEMSAAGSVGMELNLDLVPLRQDDLKPWEIMLSESQERMLLIGKIGQEAKIKEVFEKWELEVSKIGKVTDTGRVCLTYQGENICDVPAYDLVLGGGAPQYKRESAKPTNLDDLQQYDPLELPEPVDNGSVLLKLISDPDIASKSWVFSQYDQSVRTNTVLQPGLGDAAVIRVEGTDKGLSLKTDCNSRYVNLDPRIGTARAVVEAARNVACTGGNPIAITNCLNFGNPYKPEVFYYFSEAIKGMGEACRALNTPVTGGNVSFYNETNGISVLPTPVIGMLGLLDDVSKSMGSGFTTNGDFVYLLGESKGHGLGGSLYLKAIHDMSAGAIDEPDYGHEIALNKLLYKLINMNLISSAHDISEGGLAVCLTECCLTDKEELIGVSVDFPALDSIAAHLFGEYPGRVVVSAQEDNSLEVENLCTEKNIPCQKIGFVGGERFIWDGLVDLTIDELASAYYNAIPELMS